MIFINLEDSIQIYDYSSFTYKNTNYMVAEYKKKHKTGLYSVCFFNSKNNKSNNSNKFITSGDDGDKSAILWDYDGKNPN
jgi:hypothetical protein